MVVTKEQIERINELYKKKTESGLTEEEQIEQAKLRKLYIESFKSSLKSHLDNIEFVDGDTSAEGHVEHDHKHEHENEHTHADGHKHLHKHGKNCSGGSGSCGCNHKH